MVTHLRTSYNGPSLTPIPLGNCRLYKSNMSMSKLLIYELLKLLNFHGVLINSNKPNRDILIYDCFEIHMTVDHNELAFAYKCCIQRCS